MTEVINQMVIGQNLDQILQTMKILKESSGRNNHNAPKLIEKYNDLAREALSNGDKIFQKIIATCRSFY